MHVNFKQQQWNSQTAGLAVESQVRDTGGTIAFGKSWSHFFTWETELLLWPLQGAPEVSSLAAQPQQV
jgi:hypothetical protein